MEAVGETVLLPILLAPVTQTDKQKKSVKKSQAQIKIQIKHNLIQHQKETKTISPLDQVKPKSNLPLAECNSTQKTDPIVTFILIEMMKPILCLFCLYYLCYYRK